VRRMDLPATSSDIGRGLPPDQGPPPVRLYIASGLCRDPENDGNLDAFVDYTKTATQPVPPASQGISRLHPIQEGTHPAPAVFPQVAPNVGRESFHISSGMDSFHVSDREKVDEYPLASGFTQLSADVDVQYMADRERQTRLPDRKFSMSLGDAGYSSGNANSKLLSDVKQSLTYTDVRPGVELDLQSLPTHTLHRESRLTHGFKTDEPMRPTHTYSPHIADDVPRTHTHC